MKVTKTTDGNYPCSLDRQTATNMLVWFLCRFKRILWGQNGLARLTLRFMVCALPLIWILATTDRDSAGKVLVFELPTHVRSSIEYELLTNKIPTYKRSNEKERSRFSAISRSLVEHQLFDGGQRKLLQALTSLKNDASSPSALLLQGVPQDPHVPETPTDGRRRSIDKVTEFAEVMSAGLAGIAKGHLVAYEMEKEYSNPFFHMGFPLKTGGGSAINHAKSIPWHLDMSYLDPDLIPDLLVLVCIREGNDDKVETVLINNKKLIRFLPKSVQMVLREPRYILKQPTWVESWDEKPKPLLLGPVHDPVVIVPSSGKANVELANPSDVEAEYALEALYRAMEDMENQDLVGRVHLKAGDVLIFHNKRNLHSRIAYRAPLFDGKDRALIRSYYITDLDGVDFNNGYVVFPSSRIDSKVVSNTSQSS